MATGEHTARWTFDLYSEALDAADYILEDVLRIPLLKAQDPLTDTGFIVIVQQMAQMLAKMTHGVDADAVRVAMSHLDVNWPDLTEAQRAAAIQAMNQGIAAHFAAAQKQTLPKIVATLKAQGAKIVGDVKKTATKQFKFSIGGSFTVKDQKVIDHAAASQAHYIRDEWGVRQTKLSQVARDVVARGLDRGAGRQEIATDLQAAMQKTAVQRSIGYWKLISGVFVARSRTYGQLASYSEAGIEAYQFEAVLDEVTSNVCRFMHGRKFDVGDSLGRYHTIAQSDDPEAVKEVTPWVNIAQSKGQADTLYVKQGTKRVPIATVKQSAEGQADETGSFHTTHSDKSLQAMGVCMPPLHGHCRSTVVPIFGESRGVVPAMPEFAPQERLGLSPPPQFRTPLQTIGGEPEVVHPKPDEEFFGLQPPPALRLPMIDHGPMPAPQPAEVIIPPDYDRIVQRALDALDEQDKLGAGMVKHGNPHMLPMAMDQMLFQETKVPGVVMAPTPPMYPKPSGQKIAAIKKKPPETLAPTDLKKLIVASGTDPYTGEGVVHPAKVRALIKAWEDNPKPLGPILVYRSHGGALLMTVKPEDAAVVAAAKLLGQPLQMHVVDLDAYKEQQANKPPPKPKVPAATQAAIDAIEPPKPPEHLDAATILHEKIGEQLGSNKGGFYIGKDGVKRYVKFYADPSQAQCEALANGVYRALGLGAAESSAVQTPQGLVHAATAIEGGKTLGTMGLTPERAKEVLKGLVADMLLGNWDVVGASFDNVVFVDGKAFRIDTGGSLLFRAQGGRKPQAALDGISEWEKFFDGTNPKFRELAQAAGITSPEDMVAELQKQMAQIRALRDKAGGWDKLVATMAPGFTGPDRDRVVETLKKREELLDAKIKEAAKPKEKPKPGAMRFYEPIVGGTPIKPLGFGVLPPDRTRLPHVPLPYHPAPSPSAGAARVKPGGERLTDYQDRARQAASKLPAASRAAIQDFTGSGYHAIRAHEDGRTPDKYIQPKIDALRKAFDIMPPEPGTVFRGIHGVPVSMIDQIMSGKLVRLGHGNEGATTSASWETSTAYEGFGVSTDPYDSQTCHIMYVIHGKTQIAIETVSTHPHEHEVLFSKDAVFRPRTVSRMQGRERVFIVELEEVLPEDMTEDERAQLKKGLILALP